MQGTLLGIAARLTDDELLHRVSVLARCERAATVELVAHLVELEERGLHLAQGYGSLFSYCTEALRLAEHAAYNRIEAARASKKFPVVLDRLAEGSVNLSTVRLLAPHLTSENHLRVLDEAARKSKREVEQLVARLAPRPDAPAFLRKLPQPKLLSQAPAEWGRLAAGGAAPCVGTAPATAEVARTQAVVPAAPATAGGAIQTTEGASGTGAPAGTAALGSRSPRPVIAPLSPERYRVQFTVRRETHENLRRVQELLRREIPDGDPGAIFDLALKLLLEDVARKKLAATSKPRPGRTTLAGSRHVPAHVRRAVWLRDAGQCAFVAKAGRRCRERAFLEFHHVDPYAIGGETSLANLSLRCRAHNVHESERLFGPFVPVTRGGVSRGCDSPRGELGRARDPAAAREASDLRGRVEAAAGSASWVMTAPGTPGDTSMATAAARE